MVTAQASTQLKIMLNGVPVETPAATLAELLEGQGFGGMKVATAVNGEFVPARGREAKRLAAGDKVEVVSARQGG